jgi:TRAP-type uncharacterized transport system fused permease subunit
MIDANYFPACIDALKLSISAFVFPFIFVMRPELMLMGSAWGIINVVGTSVIGLVALAFFIEGYMSRKTTLLERMLLLGAAVALFLPFSFLFSLFGIILFGLVIFLQRSSKTHTLSN